MKLNDVEFVFLDCQSTGASPAHGNLLEIAWTKARAKDELGPIQSYLLKQPADYPIPHMIYALTGISQSEMQDAIEPQVACQLLQTTFQQPEVVDHALIHYGRFERAFLEDLYKRCSISSPDPKDTDSQMQLPYKILCTYEIARRLFPNLPTRGIKGLAGFFGAPFGEVKRAACHVAATRLIWQGLLEELRKIGIETIALLEEWIASAPVAKRTKLEYPLAKAKRSGLPSGPGVYRMLDRLGNVLYVGKATSLKSRVNSYFRGRAGKDARRLEMLTRVHDLQITECDTILEAALLESDEIKRLNPPYNVVLKEGRRQLLYYDRQLLRWNPEPSSEFPLGPFAGPFQMEPLIRLAASLEAGEFDPHLFFDYIDPELLKEGFEIFRSSANLAIDCRKPRHFLAFALREYKRTVRQLLAQSGRREGLDNALGNELNINLDSQLKSGLKGKLKDELQSELNNEVEGEPKIELDDDPSNDDLVEELELTAEDIAGKFLRMFLRAARAYLQARLIQALSNTTISFVDKQCAKTLYVQRGIVLASPQATPRHAEPLATDLRTDQSNGIAPMDLITFDRMRILASELGRIARTGARIDMEFKTGKKASFGLFYLPMPIR
jgi:DNA polymerase-3 subunit epsilon